LAGQDPTDEAE